MRYACLLALLLTSCAPAPRPVATANNPSPIGPEIARIVTRHNTIIVRAGTEPTYRVESSTGSVVINDATLKMIIRTNPEWSDRIKSMQDNVVWAGIDAGD
jgi:hypothetical protein